MIATSYFLYYVVMNLAGLLKVKREDIITAAQKHGAQNVRVFGSAARGDDHPDSDVDFLVDMEPGRSLLDMGGLLMELRELLGRDVDVVTERGLKPRIRDRVLKEAVPL
jgi:predicted nucleotidyltransferase